MKLLTFFKILLRLQSVNILCPSQCAITRFKIQENCSIYLYPFLPSAGSRNYINFSIYSVITMLVLMAGRKDVEGRRPSVGGGMQTVIARPPQSDFGQSRAPRQLYQY